MNTPSERQCLASPGSSGGVDDRDWTATPTSPLTMVPTPAIHRMCQEAQLVAMGTPGSQ